MVIFGLSEREVSFLPHLMSAYLLIYFIARFFRLGCPFQVVFLQGLSINQRRNSIACALLLFDGSDSR